MHHISRFYLRRGLLRFLFLFLFLANFLPAPAAESLWAQDRSYHLEHFHAAIEVRPDAVIEVREQIRFRFDGAFNGVYRWIPVESRTPQGFRQRLYLDVVDVTGEDGSELRYEEERKEGNRRLKIWVPDAVDTARTVTIRYRVSNALRFFEGGEAAEFSDPHDELYWNVTGDEWEVPIRSASAMIELPEGAMGVRATGFTGGYGSRERAIRMDTLESSIYIETTRGLEFREGLTVAVGWEPGVVRRPGIVRRAGWFLGANWILLLPLLVTLFMARRWYLRGRDPRPGSIAPRYAPPEGLAPAEVGTLVDHTPDTRDIVATLVDLAVRGYLTIEEVEEDEHPVKALFTGTEYRFGRKRDPDEWEGLHMHEEELLKGLFGIGGIGSEVKLSDLENEFYKKLDRIKNGIFRRLLELGYYERRPDKVKRRYLGVGGAIVAVGGALIPLLQEVAPGISVASAALALAGSALPVIGFGFFMPARTGRGTRALEKILGFEEFLDRVEEDRFKRMITGPDLFERYLPHAMALGVEKRWARAFDGLLTEPPEWYVSSGGGHFHPVGFTGSLGDLGSSTGQAFTSAPRSSGGSGFSGGGFSGGGGGGGGGGAF